MAKSQNYLFLNNYYGYAKPLNGKLKTMNAFGLGGLNFKGFDYKGMVHMREIFIEGAMSILPLQLVMEALLYLMIKIILILNFL